MSHYYSIARKRATTGAIARFLAMFNAVAAPVTGMPVVDEVGVGEDLMMLPVPVGYGVVVLASITVKLAHEMRVLFAKWKTRLRLPKYAPSPSTKDV